MVLKRNRKLARQPEQTQEPLEKLVILWILRILVNMGGFQNAIGGRRMTLEGLKFLSHPGIRTFLGISDLWRFMDDMDSDSDEQLAKQRQRLLFKALRTKLVELEALSPSFLPPAALATNIDQLSKLVNLNAVESSILMFAVLLKTQEERSGSVCLNSIPRFISGERAGW